MKVNPPNRWKCSLHQFTGRIDDESLKKHQDEEHDGALITVMWTYEPEDE